MPELPEVETVARTLAPHIVGKKICAIHVLNDKTWQGEILAQSLVSAGSVPYICSTSRRGKLLLINLKYLQEHNSSIEEQSQQTIKKQSQQIFAIAFHLKMTGQVFTYSQGTMPNKHTRLIIDLEDGTRMFFNDVRKFGYARALSEESLKNWDFWQKLGPDPFEINAKEFAAIFYGRGGTIKSLILNQQLVSGIGNIYTDEGLFSAKIHPQRRASDMSVVELEKLHRCMVDVLEESIRFCGSSIRDYRTANGDVGSFQNKFYVYNRAGQPCKVCNTLISRITVAGRTTSFCPCCQIL